MNEDVKFCVFFTRQSQTKGYHQLYRFSRTYNIKRQRSEVMKHLTLFEGHL